ncbi:MAG TPA: response regulator [Burkholderiales bacterium]|nr:response regulator [Burkholderiales bacterium]
MDEVDILLVEDNPDDAELTLRALRKSNATDKLLHLDDGAKAIDYLFNPACAKLPRFILLDLKLPKIDGLEVLRRVKGDQRTRGVPVVVLTSSKEERDVMASYGLGVNSYVVKPVSFDHYMRIVADVGRYWNELNQLPQVIS